MEMYLLIFICAASVLLFTIIGVFIYLFKRSKKKADSLFCEFYLKNGSREVIRASIKDKFVEFNEGRYIITPDSIKSEELADEKKKKMKVNGKYQIMKEFVMPEFRKKRIVNFVSFMEGVELPFKIYPDPLVLKSVKFVGAEALDQMFKTKLIKELNYELNNGSKLPTWLIVVLIVLVGGTGLAVVGYFVAKKFMGA